MDMAACLVKVGDERGLVMELRRVQAELRELRDNVCATCNVKDGEKMYRVGGPIADSGVVVQRFCQFKWKATLSV